MPGFDASLLLRNYNEIRRRMAQACDRAGRAPESARLIAVTKSVDLGWIRGLIALGQLELAENRPQQLAQRAASVTESVRWHFIGHLQRNKIDLVLPVTSCIHSVDSLRLLRSLADQAGKTGHRPQILLEVNISGEASKGGFSTEEIRAAWHEITAIANLQIQGLMTMAPLSDDPETARPVFRGLREFRDELVQLNGGKLFLPELSMGMSGDFEVAIEEGATMVRVGSRLFEE